VRVERRSRSGVNLCELNPSEYQCSQGRRRPAHPQASGIWRRSQRGLHGGFDANRRSKFHRIEASAHVRRVGRGRSRTPVFDGFSRIYLARWRSLPWPQSHYRCLVSADEYGPWDALSVSEVQAVFAKAPFRWWISGGRALDLFVGRSWRAHGDTDVGVLRRDVAQLRTVTKSWDVQVAAAGILSTWRDRALNSERHENNLWAGRIRSSLGVST